MKAISIIKYTFAVIGLLFITGTIWHSTATYRFLKIATQVTGSVVYYEMSRDSDGDTFYKPVIVFYSVNGEPHSVTS